MAKYTGYITVPHSSYAVWKAQTNGNGYDVDGTYGCQCWDFVSLFWYNIGFPTEYPHITNSSAYTMWQLRDQNKGYNGSTYFDLIYNVNDIKQGDIIVFNYFSGNQYGHTGFADVDYRNWIPDPEQPNEFPVLSENNGGTPDPDGGAYTNVHGYDISLFLGAFRYKGWETPTPITTSVTRNKFPWVIYARKLRERR